MVLISQNSVPYIGLEDSNVEGVGVIHPQSLNANIILDEGSEILRKIHMTHYVVEMRNELTAYRLSILATNFTVARKKETRNRIWKCYHCLSELIRGDILLTR